MNYLHNIIHNYMKDHGIKPLELFEINLDGTPGNPNKLTGYFTPEKEFVTEKNNKMKTAEVLLQILSGKANIQPLKDYTPEKGDPYYYLEEQNTSQPNRLETRKTIWNDTLTDYSRHMLGNCFRNEAEATKYKNEKYYHKIKNDYENKKYRKTA